MAFSKALAPHLNALLVSSVTHLHDLLPTFSHYYLSSSSPSPPSSSEDEVIGLPQLCCPIIDFISTVVRGGKAKAWIRPENLAPLVVTILGWLQMTEEDVCVFLHIATGILS